MNKQFKTEEMKKIYLPPNDQEISIKDIDMTKPVFVGKAGVLIGMCVYDQEEKKWFISTGSDRIGFFGNYIKNLMEANPFLDFISACEPNPTTTTNNNP